jgi:site-specific recombinase XerD
MKTAPFGVERAARAEKLPKFFQRIATTGMLRVIMKVPRDCRARLPAPHTDKSYLIEHLGTADLKVAERIERERNLIHTMTRLIEQAKPRPTKWAHLPPSAAEIERMRAVIDMFMKADPADFDDSEAGNHGKRLLATLKSRLSLPDPIGRFEQVPVEPSIHHAIMNSTDTLTFDAGTDHWAAEKKVPGETIDLYRSSMRRFSKHVGHDNFRIVTRADLIGWKTALVQTKLASKSIRDRIGHVKTIAQHLFENDLMDENINPPDKPVRYVARKNPHTARLNFSPEDRAAIYRAALIETRPLYRWSNLLMLFSGMRVEEFAEADTRDIVEINGIWCFLINYDFKLPNQNIKNDESIRKIPLHSAIIKAGFLDYVRSLPPGPLFPMLETSKHGRQRADASRKLGSWLREVALIVDPRKVNHSHRHSAETLMEAAGVPKARAYKITGHASADTGEDYTHRSVETLKDAVEKIPVPLRRSARKREPNLEKTSVAA